MRRSSIVAPLLLIGIGLLFLIRNLHPDLPLVDYLAKFWPFILVLWGVVRLFEIAVWAASSKPLPSAGVSGGEWVLVAFLCLFGLSLHTIHGMAEWWPRNGFAGGMNMFGESFEYPIGGEKACSPTPRVVLENFRGGARITGADVNSVKVTGRKTVRSLDQSGADRGNQDSPFELAGDATRVIVRNNQDRVHGPVRISAEMEITVPRGASVEAHGRGGDFEISDIGGSVEIVSDSAGVRLNNIGGDARMDLRRSDLVRAVNVKGTVDLKSRGSDIEMDSIDGPVTVSGSYSGVVQFHNLAKPLRYTGVQTELHIERLPGQVRMALNNFNGSNLVGPVRLTSRSRDVQISDFTNTLEVSVDRGDIDLRPNQTPLARIQARTKSGDVILSLPPSSQFTLTATTDQGETTNDYGPPVNAQTERRGGSLHGSVGSGPTVNVQTGRGNITVRKASPGDAAPAMSHVPSSSEPLKRLEQ